MKRTPPPRRKVLVPAEDIISGKEPLPGNAAPAVTSGSNTAHSILGPSYSKTWLSCSAALAMGKGVTDSAGSAAWKGTVMHYVSELCINTVLNDGPDAKGTSPYEYVGIKPMDSVENRNKKMPEADVVFTREMADGIKGYVDYACGLIADGAHVRLEERIELNDQLFIPREDTHVFGSGDMTALVLIAPGEYRVIIGDLKTGRNKVTAAGDNQSGNSQLMLYAGGYLPVARKLLAEIDPAAKITEVELVIIAPYMGFESGRDSFIIKPEGVEAFMVHAATRAQKAWVSYQKGKKALTMADFKPSHGACQWCKARDICAPKNKALLAELMDDEPEPVKAVPVEVQPAPVRQRKPAPKRKGDRERKPAPPRRVKPAEVPAVQEPHVMTPEEIVRAYEKLPALKAHIKSVENAMNQLMHSGKPSFGWKLVMGSGGKRSWTKEAEAKLADLMVKYALPADTIKTEALLSPAQVEALDVVRDNAELKEAVRALMTRPDDKPTIAPATDKRPEWKAVGKDDLSLD